MSGLVDILKAVAPTLATALGGPLAGAAVSFLSSKLGVDPGVVEQTVAGMGPADLVKMKQLDEDFQLEMAKVGISVQLGQIDVDKEEAKSTNWFVAGWRPAVGWIGALSFGYVAMVEPIARFVATMYGYHGGFPTIDTSVTMQVLLGLLGLGAMRTYEKSNGTSNNH